MDEPVVLQIVLPEAYAGDLEDVLRAAAAEVGAVEEFRLEEADLTMSASELQFDPITIAAGLYVANLVVASLAGAAIPAGFKKLIEKMRANRSEPAEGRIMVVMPDLKVIYLDVDDSAGAEVALARLADELR